MSGKENMNEMQRSCGLVRDLLPLYVEDIESEDSREFIEAHLSCCPDCRAEEAKMRSARLPSPDEALPLKRLRRTILKRMLMLSLIAAAFIAALAATVFARLTKKHYLAYGEAVVCSSGEPGELCFSFSEKVTGFEKSAAPDTVLGVTVVRYNVQAWYTLLDRLRSSERPQSCSVIVPGGTGLSGKTGDDIETEPFRAARKMNGELAPPDGSALFELTADGGFGEVCTLQAGRVELRYDISPSASRLPFLIFLGTVSLAVLLLIVFAVLALMRRIRAAKTVLLIMLLPLSFAAAFPLANGFRLYSHTPGYDLVLTGLICIPLYAAFACLFALWSMRRGSAV